MLTIIISNNMASRLLSDEMYPKADGGLVKLGLLLNLPRLEDI